MNHAIINEIFRYFMADKVWLGYNSGHFWFRVPNYYQEKQTDFKIDEQGQKWRRMGNICWFTNMDIDKRHEPLDLFHHYSPDDYPVYDNYSAININKTVEIPDDYDDLMGVPITFLDKYSPDQFELIGNSTMLAQPIVDKNTGKRKENPQRFYVDGKRMYDRLVIRKRVNRNGH